MKGSIRNKIKGQKPRRFSEESLPRARLIRKPLIQILSSDSVGIHFLLMKRLKIMLRKMDRSLQNLSLLSKISVQGPDIRIVAHSLGAELSRKYFS